MPRRDETHNKIGRTGEKLITLCHGTGAQDFQISKSARENDEIGFLMLNARQMLLARWQDTAADLLGKLPFFIAEATNVFDDEFLVLIAQVGLQEYESWRVQAEDPSVRRDFSRIADVFQELGCYIRFIAIDFERLSPESWDVFICHASEDKANIVEPIYRHLDSRGIRCWYDRDEILWGDSIITKINEGLRSSQFVTVVISPALLAKPWAKKEMNAALSQEIEQEKTRVLPLMVGTDEEIQRIKTQLILQADKKYLRWSGNPEEVERELRLLLRRETFGRAR